MADDRARLLELIETYAVQRGHFILASGRESNYYLDGRMVALHPEGAYLIGKLLFAQMEGLDVQAVGGLTLGADPVATAVSIASYLEGRPINAFLVRKEPKGHGTKKLVEGPLAPGSRVVIVEDTMTTGGSALKAVAAVEELGCEVAAVMVVIDREEGARETIEGAGYRFMPLFTVRDLGL
jgi:orotate phosphoribosyltransferase